MSTKFFVFALILVVSVPKVFTSTPKLLVLSFGGFHPSYFTRQNTPILYSLKKIAAKPPYMTSIFPTKTFPTHFSLSTGVHPEVHGVYNNTIFDKNGEPVTNTEEQFQTNKLIVPIWIENQNTQGRHSGVMMWPGSEYQYQGVLPTYIQKYDPTMLWNQRADIIVEWMTNADKKANLVMAYFEDTPCYDNRVRDVHLRNHLSNIDNTFAQIYTKLKEKIPESDGFDIIIISNHGTQSIPFKRVLIIDNIDQKGNEVKDMIISGPLLFLKPKSEFRKKVIQYKEDELYDVVYEVYTKDDSPDHFKMNTPILEGIIILVAKEGYSFSSKSKMNNIIRQVGIENFVTDENGYNPLNKDMRSFFLGIGPKFKDNKVTFSPFNLIDVYPLLKNLLELPGPASVFQNNITLNKIVQLLLEKDNTKSNIRLFRKSIIT